MTHIEVYNHKLYMSRGVEKKSLWLGAGAPYGARCSGCGEDPLHRFSRYIWFGVVTALCNHQALKTLTNILPICMDTRYLS